MVVSTAMCEDPSLARNHLLSDFPSQMRFPAMAPMPGPRAAEAQRPGTLVPRQIFVTSGCAVSPTRIPSAIVKEGEAKVGMPQSLPGQAVIPIAIMWRR
jgi:hypothetical protein